MKRDEKKKKKKKKSGKEQYGQHDYTQNTQYFIDQLIRAL